MSIEWTEAVSREYVRYMERVVRHDHRRFAARIVADWPDVPAGATAVDVAGGPGFLLLEVAPHLRQPRLIVTDPSPTMIELGRERAAARGFSVEWLQCPAEKLALGDGSADMILCKHFLRLAPDLEGALREMLRVLRPGGRAYFIDFNAEGPRLGGKLLELWVRLTAPKFLRETFVASRASGLRASPLPARLRALGFCDAAVLHGGVSYLIRAGR